MRLTMTDDSPVQPQTVEGKSQQSPHFIDILTYARHMEASHAQAAAYARHLEQVVADFQQAGAETTLYVRKLETELANAQQQMSAEQRHAPPSADPETITYIRKLEQTYSDAVTYAHTLENEL